jgi:hypothetical protein
MMPRAAVVPMVAMVARSAATVPALSLLLGSMLFGLFFGFDFPAELFFFGVFGFAAFAFVVAFFDRFGFAFGFFGFVFFGFGFVVFLAGEERCHRGGREADGVGGGGSGEQHQRGEQEDQEDREFAHSPYIGA